mmetsp:Transcript_8056/g.24081  ORF Transcript_8056/g.24081 Transcript_8056/m.24081 type:complete len:214 (+) Transcript_8056:679-1320(+)
MRPSSVRPSPPEPLSPGSRRRAFSLPLLRVESEGGGRGGRPARNGGLLRRLLRRGGDTEPEPRRLVNDCMEPCAESADWMELASESPAVEATELDRSDSDRHLARSRPAHMFVAWSSTRSVFQAATEPSRKDPASRNMWAIVLTSDVSQRPRSWSKARASQNMSVISSQADTSQPPIGWSKAAAPWNMASIVVTEDVSQRPMSWLKAFAWRKQ